MAPAAALYRWQDRGSLSAPVACAFHLQASEGLHKDAVGVLCGRPDDVRHVPEVCARMNSTRRRGMAGAMRHLARGSSLQRCVALVRAATSGTMCLAKPT